MVHKLAQMQKASCPQWMQNQHQQDTLNLHCNQEEFLGDHENDRNITNLKKKIIRDNLYKHEKMQ